MTDDTQEHLQRVRAHFHDNAGHYTGKWAVTYQQADNAATMVLQERMEIAIGFLANALPERGALLDAGCGGGLIGARLARQGFTMTEVDIAPAMVEAAAKAFADQGLDPEKHRFLTGDVPDLDLPAGSLHGVMALGFLEYQADELRALEAFKRLLRPGGALVISGPNRRSVADLGGLRPLWRRLRGKGGGAIPTLHTYTRGRLDDLLTRAGFTVRAHRPHGFAAIPGLSRLLGPRGEILIHRGLTGLARILPPTGVFANNIVTWAERP